MEPDPNNLTRLVRAPEVARFGADRTGASGTLPGYRTIPTRRSGPTVRWTGSEVGTPVVRKWPRGRAARWGGRDEREAFATSDRDLPCATFPCKRGEWIRFHRQLDVATSLVDVGLGRFTLSPGWRADLSAAPLPGGITHPVRPLALGPEAASS